MTNEREKWLVYLELIEGYVKTIQSHHEELNDEAGRDRSRSQTLTLATHSLDLLGPLPDLIRRAALDRAIEELEWAARERCPSCSSNRPFDNKNLRPNLHVEPWGSEVCKAIPIRTRIATLRAEREEMWK